MIERCPCCHAQLKQAAICPRCRADLNSILLIEEYSQQYLFRAIQFFLADKVEQSCIAINHSLQLKKTAFALNFREFLIDQQSLLILDLLDQSQQLPAKKMLYLIRHLIPYSKKLQQLDSFTNYLLINNPAI